MKILILGAEGKLGTSLVKIFSDDPEYQIIAWDKEDIDITDKALVQGKITDLAPKIIINAAALNYIDKCERSVKAYNESLRVNRDAVSYIADSAIATNAIFVHFSTDYVFDKYADDYDGEMIKKIKSQGGFREEDATSPINKFGETKELGEQEIIKRSGKGLQWYLVRSSKLFGPPGRSRLSRPCFFDLIMDTARNYNELKIVDEEMSCFTYTPDLAEAVKSLVESNRPFGIYHIANSSPTTWYGAAVELFAQMGNKQARLRSVRAKDYPHAAKRPSYSILLNTKLPQLRDWREALRDYLEKKHNRTE